MAIHAETCMFWPSLMTVFFGTVARDLLASTAVVVVLHFSHGALKRVFDQETPNFFRLRA